MNVDELGIQWFRGAAARVALRPRGKSVVVYGPNGSGKSSFVDACEFLLTGGNVQHLSHEYSGRRLEKAVINTHAPAGVDCAIDLRLTGGTKASASVSPDGQAHFVGRSVLASWDCDAVILRQDQVAAFVHATKGQKYSALLPLIGMQSLETAAVNLKNLAKRVREISEFERSLSKLETLRERWSTTFPGKDNAAVAAELKALHARYAPPGAPPPSGLNAAVAELRCVLRDRTAGHDVVARRHAMLAGLHRLNLPGALTEAVVALQALAGSVDPLITERLALLQHAQAFALRLDRAGAMACPACGSEVDAGDFRRHVDAEHVRWKEALSAYDARRRALAKLADAVSTAKSSLESDDLKQWRSDAAQDGIRAHLDVLAAADCDALRAGTASSAFAAIADAIPRMSSRVEECAREQVVGVEDLVHDTATVEAAGAYPEIRSHEKRVHSVESLLRFLVEAEAEVRAEIKRRTEQVLSAISGDLQKMWATLHPGEPIDEVRLYQAPDAEKAVDIALRFHGKEQLSPRLTLSEGHRNSLGLCVFFAFAKRSQPARPVLLDDVVTSFDREHRGFVADLLLQHFSGRQVLLFTHDTEWFTELRTRLPGCDWAFERLLPWDSPEVGLRWNAARDEFDEAKVLLPLDAKAAANRARATMDVRMGIMAERLEIPVPHLRGPPNDSRHAQEFLRRFRAEAEQRLKKRGPDGTHEAWLEPLRAVESVCELLQIWANAATHGRYVTRAEAERVISVCDNFVRMLICADCETYVWHSHVPGKHLRCECGALRWRK